LIGAGARLERALVLPGTTIGKGASLTNAIAGFGVTLNAGETAAGELVTAHHGRVPLR
jgi:ADP-glucose pyrophosphorylase